MSASITRGQLLSRSAKGGAALLVAGSALGPFAGVAAAAPLPTGDLAYVRLLVGVELLASDFYTQAIAAANASPDDHVVPEARVPERAGALPVGLPGSSAGRARRPPLPGTSTSATRRAHSTRQGSILKLAKQLEDLSLGAYLGALAALQTPRDHGRRPRGSPPARRSTRPTSRRRSAARRSRARSRMRSPSTRSRTRLTRTRRRKGATLRFSRFISLLALVV